MVPVVGAARWWLPPPQGACRWFVDFNQQRIASRGFAADSCPTITIRTSREGTEQVDLCKKLDEIARSNRASFKKVLVCVAREPCAHEHIAAKHSVLRQNCALERTRP